MKKSKLSLRISMVILSIFFGMIQSVFAENEIFKKLEKGIWEKSKDEERINGFVCSTDKNLGLSTINISKFLESTIPFRYRNNGKILYNYVPAMMILEDSNLLMGNSMIFITTKDKISEFIIR